MKDQEKKESENTSIPQWEKQNHIGKGILDNLTPLLNCLVVVLEEEKKRTIQKLEETKNLLDKMKTK